MDYSFLFLILIPLSLLLYLLYRYQTSESLPLFTISDLENFNGSNGKTYIGVKDLIFDVSACEAYRPGESYAVFAGKDGTVALAKMSLSPEHMNIQVPLTAQEEKTLQEWVVFYRDRKKYPIVGRLTRSKAKTS